MDDEKKNEVIETKDDVEVKNNSEVQKKTGITEEKKSKENIDVNKDTFANDNVNYQKDNSSDKANTLCFIALALVALDMALTAVLREYSGVYSVLSGISSLAVFTLIVYAKAKYPQNRFASILFKIMIGFNIFGAVCTIIIISVIILACGSQIGNYHGGC